MRSYHFATVLAPMGFPVATYFHHVGQAYDCCLKLLEDVAGFPCVHSYLYNTDPLERA